MARKRKRRIKWKGVALLAAYVAVVLTGLYFLVFGIVRLVGGCSHAIPTNLQGDKQEVEHPVDPMVLRSDSILAEKINRLIGSSTRLDSTVLAISVFDLSGQRSVFAHHADEALIPASCMKIPTALAALHILGLDYRYRTKIDATGYMQEDTLVGTLHLQAGCDPLLTSFSTLVGQVREAGIHVVKGDVVVNLEREDTLTSHPSTESWDIPYSMIPLLLRGRAHVEREFLYELAQQNIMVQKSDETTERDSTRTVASHETPLKDVLTPMLIHSSNVKAEAVFYLLDAYQGLTHDKRMHWDAPHASIMFWEKAFACHDNVLDYFRTMSERKQSTLKMVDGSGLSPLNRLSAHSLVEMLQYAWHAPLIRDYLVEEGLASPCSETRRGSLKGRLSEEKYRERIFVKTGTLTTHGVSSLAGYIHANNDLWFAFAIINNNCPVAEGRLFQDEFCKLFFTLPKE
ncbi:MAG: D-alanyl-D-alanine carboxypeptidase [Bacteroidales bacterium]|nr:D-alanyl-D-alanine carboxypeptidase [Candidatus Physcousia equi]